MKKCINVPELCSRAEALLKDNEIRRAGELVQEANQANEGLADPRSANLPDRYIDNRLRIRKVRNKLRYDLGVQTSGSNPVLAS